MKKVCIYTDGACSGNPGPGGWAAILSYNGHERELSGGEPATTNNRMELIAAISALEALKEPCEVELWTDSQYLARAVNEGWLAGWKRRGWRRKEGELKNPELWQALDALLLECTDLSAFAEPVQKATGIPVYDICGLVEYAAHAVCRRKWDQR